MLSITALGLSTHDKANKGSYFSKMFGAYEQCLCLKQLRHEIFYAFGFSQIAKHQIKYPLSRLAVTLRVLANFKLQFLLVPQFDLTMFVSEQKDTKSFMLFCFPK